MGKKLFVGGLSWGTTDDSLLAAFEPYGDVTEAKVILDKNSGRSRGFGFVTFDSADEARSAMEALNDSEIDGRAVRVELASERR